MASTEGAGDSSCSILLSAGDEKLGDNQEVEPITSGGSNSSSFTKNQKIVLASCLIAQFFCFICSSLPAPFLPLLNENHNLRSDITGFVIGLLPLTEVFASPLFGKLLNHVAVKTMLVTGLFVCGGFTILFGLLDYFPAPDVTDDSPAIIFIIVQITIRILQSIGAGCVLVSSLTLLATTFTENTTTVMGYSQTVIGLGYMCGPALGSGLYKVGGFAMVFCVIGAAIMISSLVVGCCLPADDGSHTEESNSLSARQILTKKIVGVLVLTVLIGTLWSSIEPVIEPELREVFGLTSDVSALTFLLASATYTISCTVFGKALDYLKWLKPMHLIILGFIINSGNYLVMGPSPLIPAITRPLWMLLLCLAVLGFGDAMLVMPTLDLLSFSDTENELGENIRMDKSTKAMLSGFWSSAYAFGDFLGPTFSGVMTAKTNFAWTMTCYAFACMAITAILLVGQLAFIIYRSCNQSRLSNEETLPLLAGS